MHSTYAYDKNNRLSTETKVTGSTTAITRYAYDDNGNQKYKATETISPVGGTQGYNVSVSGDSSLNNDVTLSDYDGLNQLKRTTTGASTIDYA